MGKVAILGASGLVGRIVFERLRTAGMDVLPLVHDLGNAWSVLRYAGSVTSVDVRDEAGLVSALEGATHVVDCSLPPWPDMPDAMRAIVNACCKCRIQRLVHLSSVTVYGERPGVGALSETTPTLPAKRSYGWFKKLQDDIVLEAHQAGLSSIVICPPHVSGPGSRFLLMLIRAIRQKSFALVDHGCHPCNVVDVRNLAHAIDLALAAPMTDGRRIFVTDGGELCWRDLVQAIAPLAGVQVGEIPHITREECEVLTPRPLTILGGARRILSEPAVRDVLRGTALVQHKGIAAALAWGWGKVGRGRAAADSLHKGTSASRKSPQLEPWLCSQQLRDVRYQIDRARIVLDYTPQIDFCESIAGFQRWYESTHGFGTEWWSLARMLD